MRELHHAPLELLEALAIRGARFRCTKPVLGELGKSSLWNTLRTWEREGWLESESCTSKERKQASNALRRKDKIPGKNDVGLIAVAHRLGAPLLTHDEAASKLALRLGVTVIDLTDVAAWANRGGLASVEDISEAWGDLAGFPWPGPGDPWLGSVEATLEERPKLEEVVEILISGGS